MSNYLTYFYLFFLPTHYRVAHDHSPTHTHEKNAQFPLQMNVASNKTNTKET